jgi:hypothetical protein
MSAANQSVSHSFASATDEDDCVQVMASGSKSTKVCGKKKCCEKMEPVGNKTRGSYSRQSVSDADVEVKVRLLETTTGERQ